MTREGSEYDALLAPLSSCGAPAGFAARLRARRARALEARRRRTALAVSCAALAGLAAMFVAGALVFAGSLPAIGDVLGQALSGLATAGAALARLALHDGLGRAAAAVVVLTATCTACCLAIAALVRHEAALVGRPQ